jgi:sulfonate transport system substrate-binding protein
MRPFRGRPSSRPSGRPSWPRWLAAALVVTGVAGCSSTRRKTPPASRDVLRVASQKGGTKAILTASGALGQLPYVIEWAEFPAAQHLLEALSAGAVDLGLVGDAPFQFAYQGGSPIKAVQAIRYDPRTSSSAILVPARSRAVTLADLKGLRVATGRGSAGHYLLLRALEKARLAPGDVKIVFLPPGDAKAAFSSGSVDAWSTWNPYVGAAVLHDGARILSGSTGLSTGVAFMAGNETAIQTKRPLIEDFLRRNARAQEWAAANPGPYSVVLANETGLPLDVARYTADRGARGAEAVDQALIAEQRQVLAAFKTAAALSGQRTFDRSLDDAFDATLYARVAGRF